MDNKFDRIWLQKTDDCHEVLWCQDKINDDDVEYIRLDLHDSIIEEREEKIKKLVHKLVYDRSYDETLALLRWKEKANNAEKFLGDLLAIIHGDGGHYQLCYGTEKAVEDGKKLVTNARQALDGLLLLIEHETDLPQSAANGVVANNVDEGVYKAGEVINFAMRIIERKLEK